MHWCLNREQPELNTPLKPLKVGLDCFLNFCGTKTSPGNVALPAGHLKKCGFHAGGKSCANAAIEAGLFRRMHGGSSKPLAGGQEQLVEHEPFGSPGNDCLVKMPLVAPGLFAPIVKTERPVTIHVNRRIGFDLWFNHSDCRAIAK